MPSRLGALAGRYILTRLLGEDAAVSTFEGVDSKQDWPVLIKLLPKALADDPDRQQKLERLVERLAALDHPNLLSVVEAGLEEGVPYLIAERIAVTPLAEKMDHAWEVERVARVITQVGEALAYAYRQGVTHGSLSPQNLLLAADDHVLLSDLGLESVIETPWERVQEALTSYLAPERLRGWMPDARADVYALGVILYEMLTGLQLDGPADQALAWLREIAPEVAPDLEPVLARALVTDPAVRYATVGEFMADLKPVLARYLPPQVPPPPAKPAPRSIPAPPDVPGVVPLPSPALIAPAMEGIPAIPMPEPPPMPTFDWDAFSLESIRLSLPEPLELPEPPLFPEITSEGIEFPTVTPVVFEMPELPSAGQGEAGKSEKGRPQRKRATPGKQAVRPVRRAQQPGPPAARSLRSPASPAQPAPQLQLPTDTVRRLRRPLRIILIVAAIFLLLTFSCCCWILLASEGGGVEDAPASFVPLFSLVRFDRCNRT